MGPSAPKQEGHLAVRCCAAAGDVKQFVANLERFESERLDNSQSATSGLLSLIIVQSEYGEGRWIKGWDFPQFGKSLWATYEARSRWMSARAA